MKTLEEIKSLFEHKNYTVRSEFIGDYDFRDPYREYYRQFIINYTDVRKHLYLSDLIDVAIWLNLHDVVLKKRWFSYLFASHHYIIKLAVLDYFMTCNKEQLAPGYEAKMNALLRKRLPPIVRNQVLFNLIMLHSDKNSFYLEVLKKSLTNTKDWRSIHRTMNNMNDVKIRKSSMKAICDHLHELSYGQDWPVETARLFQKIRG